MIFLVYMAHAKKMEDSVLKMIIHYLLGNFILLAEQAIFYAKHKNQKKIFSFFYRTTIM